MNNWEKRFELFRCDCIERMRAMVDNSVDFTLTDIPYDAVNRRSNGLRNLNKGAADECTFDLVEFLDGVYRVTKNSICIFAVKSSLAQSMRISPVRRERFGLSCGRSAIQVL